MKAKNRKHVLFAKQSSAAFINAFSASLRKEFESSSPDMCALTDLEVDHILAMEDAYIQKHMQRFNDSLPCKLKDRSE